MKEAPYTRWCHEMETFSALLAICAGNSPVPGEFPTQRPVTQSFDVFFDLRPNKRLSKEWWGWWFETPSCPLWCHCNDIPNNYGITIHLVAVVRQVWKFTRFVQHCNNTIKPTTMHSNTIFVWSPEREYRYIQIMLIHMRRWVNGSCRYVGCEIMKINLSCMRKCT